jgi:hypothetical protein
MSTASSRYDVELAELRAMLKADGYGIEAVGRTGDVLDLKVVVATPEACADCLVPKPLMRDLISSRLQAHALRLGELLYPAEDTDHA